MTNPSRRMIPIAISALTLAALACTCSGLLIDAAPTEAPIIEPPTEDTGGGEPTAEQPVDAPTKPPIGAPTDTPEGSVVQSEFPLPDDAHDLIEASGTLNFQTSLPMKDVPDFYRQAFADQGYTERTLLTVISDQAISMVWDGHPSGQAIVVQAVDLGGGSTNINIRLEAIP